MSFAVKADPDEESSSGESVSSESTESFTVTWVIDGSAETERYERGETPSHSDPVKPADSSYTYTFAGWTPAIQPVNANATYTAKFDAVPVETEPSEHSILISTPDETFGDDPLITVYLQEDRFKKEITSAKEGERLIIEIFELDDPILSVMSVTELRDGEAKIRDYTPSIGSHYIYLTMPGYDVVFEPNVDVDPEKEAASRSEEEASRRSESEYERSVQESIDAEKRFTYGDYEIETDVSEIVPPTGFIRAKDAMNFDRTVGSFYSTDYKLFVYYASKDGKHGFYVNDPMNRNLIPFVTFAGTGNRDFVVTGAESEKSIPGIFREQIELSLKFVEGSSATVPGYLVIDADGNTIKLIHLNSNLAESGFYVYSDDNGIVSLTEYEKYAEKESDDGNQSFTIEPSTEKAGREGISRTAVWLIIIGVILLLLIAAIVTVAIMSKHQQEEEDSIDDEEDEFDGEDDAPYPEDEEPVEEFDLSPYHNTPPAEPEGAKKEFEFNFEDAFPEESAEAKKPVKDNTNDL